MIHGAPTATDLLLLLLFSSNFTFSFFEYVLNLLVHHISETKRRKEDKKLHTALFWDSVIEELVVYPGSVQLQFSRSTYYKSLRNKDETVEHFVTQVELQI